MMPAARTTWYDEEDIVSLPRVAVLRAAWMPAEATLRDLGALTIITAALPLAVSAFNAVRLAMSGAAAAAWLDGALFPLLLAVVQLAVGEGLRRLDPRSRGPAILFAGLLLPFFPLGTLLGVALLSQLLTQGGRTVLSPAYARIVRGSPELEPPRSTLALVIGALSLPAGVLSTQLLIWLG